MNSNINAKTAIFSLKQIDEKMNIDEKYKTLGGNTGNIVFDTALSNLICGDKVFWDTSQTVLEQYDRFITTSYIWIRKNQEVSSSFKLIRNKPIIPMSVGLQSDDYDPYFQMHPSVVNELKKIEERCIIGCRGDYTADILNKHGIKNTMVIGCPSVYLGIQSNTLVKYFSGYKPHNIISNFSTFWRQLKSNEVDFLKYISKNKFNFIEQTIGDLKKEDWLEDEKSFQLVRQWLNNKKVFFSFEEWKEEIKNYDFSIGYRFHGNVMAVINGIPALFIYADSRVKEMCEFFKLPMISDKEFDIDKPIEYWYDRSDYSDFNKLIDKKREIFKEFCRKNNLILKENGVDKNIRTIRRRIKKIRITNYERKYIYNQHWIHLEFEGKHIFQSDNLTDCQHLCIKLPSRLLCGREYYLGFRVKFMTDCEQIRFWIQDDEKNFQQICFIRNDRRNDYYKVSITFKSNGEYQYLRITNSDFKGTNYFALSDIEIRELTNE